MSSNWTIEELFEWDEKVCECAKSFGLDWHPINYELVDYYEMIGAMSYSGLSSHYSHWSYGKSFEQIHHQYSTGEAGLPYEMIINSNPSTAYLMRQNDMYLQLLIMAHCVGHSDFFKNNIHFKHTNPDSIISNSRNAKKRIQSYIEDPSIGIDKVEAILDAAHAISLHTEQFGRERTKHSAIKKKYIDLIKNDKKKQYLDIDIGKIPLEKDYDILGAILEFGTHLADWEKDILTIVRDESMYFMPQIRTKVANEGWASFWHYKIINALDIPQKYHIPFMKSHNQVVCPHQHSINPYFVGFYIFNRIEKEKGLEECFFAREVYHDESLIREYIDEKACNDLGLYNFSLKKARNQQSLYMIDDVPDETGWKEIRENLIKTVGINSIPKIYVEDIGKNSDLVLRHEHDGRDLELEYAQNVVKQISNLWEGSVKLMTIIEEEEFEI